MTALLDLSDVSVAIGTTALLDRISLRLDKGQILGLVGESGSGKSLTATAALGLLPLIGGRVTAGTVRFDGQDLAAMTDRQRRDLRGRRIGFVSQNPMTALDPVQRIGEQVDVVSRLHLGLSRQAARARTLDLLTQLRIPGAAALAECWPHQLSGGMRQRGLALMLITHDMGVVAQICDRVTVLYAGRVAEEGPVAPIFAAPAHPYTAALIGCIPQDGMEKGALKGIPGAVPSALAFAPGCRFSPRCTRADDACRQVPPLQSRGQGLVACHHAGEGA
ncbi:MAG: ABC transporter ATP-binding protein [Rhodobacter sp.]|nr:ABC transporter ATP-binding protein [Rhodobacter sp.]